MGNGASTSASDSAAYPPSSTPKHQHAHSEEISSLIHFAESNYESRPDESLSALMEAMTLNSGPVKASQAMTFIKAELERPENLDSGIFAGTLATQYSLAGHSVSGANHNVPVAVTKKDKRQRVAEIVQSLLADRSTYLYQMGQQHILQQAMEDGSSVVCPHCHGMVPTKRWDQHKQYWCHVTANDVQVEICENEGDSMVLS